MYIELVHDDQGNILGGWIEDTLPEGGAAMPYAIKKGDWPKGQFQCRICLDTIMALEIEINCGQKAIIDNAGKMRIITIERFQYIQKNYLVDIANEVALPEGVKIPVGMKMRRLIRK